MIWQLLTIICGSILGGEAWIWLRDRRTQPRRAAAPTDPKHTFGEWLARKPVDLDKRDRRGY